MSGDTVMVAVRVRPFNDREKKRNAALVIGMPDDKRTLIKDPNNANDEKKMFNFDYSYWSHDGYRQRSDGYLEPDGTGSHYADQQKVFNDLGAGVLDNAWKGYNCSLFAYGQTGSGKSYSMVGYGANKGIIPIVCEELFKRIDEKKGDGIEYQVSLSMFEIYCERVRDLLSSKPPPKGGLKVREHPKQGFYVEGLRCVPVNSYKQIESKMDEGNRSRTIAATNMNATSSRAHTIVKIQFVQKEAAKNAGSKAATTKTSEINLVDLAGSERQQDAGSEGDRLKEGIVINQSLSTLGRVIKALVDKQNSKNKSSKNVQVPYRDSILTSLLKNALGGNSKTIMIAALSPADINYDETLSTLRFADRAKSIKTNAIVNESATDRMIRELKEENARLMALIKNGDSDGGATQEELDALRRQLEENQREMANMEQTWQQRLAAEAQKHGIQGDDERTAIAARRKQQPHLWNLNEDPALTNVIVHFINTGQMKIGNKQSEPPADIQLNGLSIQQEHALITNKDNKRITLKPLSSDTAILVNGNQINGETELQHNDRILFGGNHIYVFANPLQSKSGNDQQITYDMAQQEIANKSGLTKSIENGAGGGKSKADMILEEDLINLLPQVYRANAMSNELKKNVKFEIVLVSPQARGLKTGLTEIWVRMKNSSEDTDFLWEKSRFVNRYYGMQEMYQNYAEGDRDWNVSKDRDPFYESPDSEMIIGSVNVFLQSLAYMVELDEQLTITDYTGAEMGQLSVALSPCTTQGKEITGEFVESPDQLIGKNLSFKVKIMAAIGLPRQFTKSFCKFKFYDQKEIRTATISGSSPVYAHESTLAFKPVTRELTDYLKDGALYIGVWGIQSARADRKGRPNDQLLTTNIKNSVEVGATNNSTKLNVLKVLNDEKPSNKPLKVIRSLHESASTPTLSVDDRPKKKLSTSSINGKKKSSNASSQPTSRSPSTNAPIKRSSSSNSNIGKNASNQRKYSMNAIDSGIDSSVSGSSSSASGTKSADDVGRKASRKMSKKKKKPQSII